MRVKLKEICTLLNGRAYKQHELLDAGKYPVLRVGNFFSDKEFYYSDLELENNKYCDNGDLLFAWSASFGPKIWDGGKVIYHYHIWKMVLSEQVDKEFLFYQLKYLSEKIKQEGHGGIMIHTTKQEMENREIVLPDLFEQKKIVKKLTAISKLIEKKEKQLLLLDELVKSRFVELFGDDVSTIKLGDVCRMINGDRGKNYPSGDDFVEDGVPFINAGHLQNRKVEFCNMNYITEEKFNLLSQGKMQAGDILYCLRGSLGKHGLVDFERGAIASSLVILRCNQERVLPQFLLYALETPEIELQLKAANNGSSQPNLSAASVRAYDIKLPTIEQQKEFVSFVEQTDKSKFSVQRSLMPIIQIIRYYSFWTQTFQCGKI